MKSKKTNYSKSFSSDKGRVDKNKSKSYGSKSTSGRKPSSGRSSSGEEKREWKPKRDFGTKPTEKRFDRSKRQSSDSSERGPVRKYNTTKRTHGNDEENKGESGVRKRGSYTKTTDSRSRTKRPDFARDKERPYSTEGGRRTGENKWKPTGRSKKTYNDEEGLTTEGSEFRRTSTRKPTVDKVTERLKEKKRALAGNYSDKRKGVSDKGESARKKYDKPKKGYQKSYEKKRKDEPEIRESFDGEIRLNRYLSNAGICSRREADELIAAGLVSVNGVKVTELGTKVKQGDDVRFNDERLSTERKVYLIMNKPKDTITTLDDPDKRRIVTDLIIGHEMPRVYPVGRLDRNTTGVLILTNDGELSQRLMHPKYGVQKVYKATLNKNFKGEDIRTLANGVELEDGFIKPDAVVMADPAHKDEVLVELHSGKNRIVHRMFESLGYLVDKLDRVVYAGFNKKGLTRGEWRELTDREVKQLKKLVQLS